MRSRTSGRTAVAVGRDDIGWFEVPPTPAGAEPGMMSARRRQTRDRLIDAAEEIFTEYGVLAAGVELICDRAGFSRGAFYSNFADLDELYVAVIDHQADRDLTRLADRLAAIPDPVRPASPHALRETVQRVLGHYRALHDPRTSLFLTELRSFAMRRPAIRPYYLGIVRANSETTFDLINAALHRQGWRFPLPDRSAAMLLEGLYETTVVREILHGGDARRTVDQLTDVLAPMLVPLGTVSERAAG